jgi:Flp pilus assembly protein TadG
MSRPHSSRRGTAMLEFALTTLPLLFVVISLWWVCFGMWQYHTLAESVNSVARTASVHGAGCAGQTCATTVQATAQMLAASAVGIPASQLNVTLTSAASTVTCNPLTSCYSNAANWPSLTGNTALTTEISIVATYQFTSAISLWVPGHGTEKFGAVTLGANATEPVFY